MNKTILYIYIALSLGAIVALSVFLFALKNNGSLDELEKQLERERMEYFQERRQLKQKIDQIENQNKILTYRYNEAVKRYENIPTFTNYSDAINQFYSR